MVVKLEKFLDGMGNFWHADGKDLLEQNADVGGFLMWMV